MDSFWGKKELVEKISEIETIEKDIIQSDHRLIILEIEIEEEIIREEREERKEKSINNKIRCAEMEGDDWKRYAEKVETKIKEYKTEEIGSIDGRVNRIGKILNESLKETLETKEKKEEEKETKEGIEEKRKDKMGIEWDAFKQENYKRKNEEKKRERKLPKYTTGEIARMITGKHRLLTACKKIKRVRNKKEEWTTGSRKWMEKIGNFHGNLKFENINDEKEMGKIEEEARKLANKLGSEIYKKRKELKNKEWKKFAKNLEEEGWKGSKKFFDKIVRRKKERITIRKVPEKYQKEGENNNDPTAIKRMIADFWEDLYKKNEKVNELIEREETKEWFETEEWKKHKKKIGENEEIRSIMEEIEEKEIEEIIRKLKNGKMGGPDEIMNEQIKYGPKELWKEIRNIMNDILKEGYIPVEWKRIRITLIHKKEDTNDPDKYRGISLSSALYKILAKILARRIINTVEKTNLIGESQGLGKLGVSASDQARILWNIIEDADQFDEDLDIVYVDMEKAYDKVEWKALEEVLKETGLPENLINLIMELNTNLKVKIESDFGETRVINVERGIRQGCPLSPIIFCLFIEPLLRWLEIGEEGYIMNGGRVKIPSLAYMDDIVLINKNEKETKKQGKKLEEYSNRYGLKVSDKTKQTNRKDEMNREKLIIQGEEIKNIKKNKTYKYLGYWMTMDMNWKKHKKETGRKHDNLLGITGIGGIDPRVQLKIINMVINTAVEYGFHIVTYTNEELDRIDRKNKALVKRIMRISIQCPTSAIFMSKEKGGLGIRSVRETYKEISFSDWYNVINFQKEKSWGYQTFRQRFLNVKKYLEKEESRKRGEKKSWIEKIWKIMNESEITIINNRWEGLNINSERIIKIEWNEIKEKIGTNKEIEEVVKKWMEIEGIENSMDIFEKNKKKIKDQGKFMKEYRLRKVTVKEWNIIKKWTCEERGEIKGKIWEMIEKKRGSRSMFGSDKEMIGKGKKQMMGKKWEIYTDGSETGGKAGLGIWNEERMGMRFNARVFGEQTAYEGELQAIIYATCNSIEGSENIIKIDNSSVRNLGEKINEKEKLDLRKVPNPEITRLIREIIKQKKKHGTKFKFEKVKAHSGIEGNEEADKMAKRGREKELTYIVDEDMEEYMNKIEWKVNGKKIVSNCRKEIKKDNMRKREESGKTDRNGEWKRFNNIEVDERSRNIMKNKKIKKNTFEFLVKARTGMLPHAKNLMERKIENIWTNGCPVCGEVEDTEHILIKCKEYEEMREKIQERVRKYIGKITGMNKEEIVENIPIWFRENKNENSAKLDKLAGMLGYIPKQLRNEISKRKKGKNRKGTEEEGKEKNKIDKRIGKTIRNIQRMIVEGAWKIWKERNEMWKRKGEERNEEEEINLRGMIQRIRPQNKPMKPRRIEEEDKEIIPIRKRKRKEKEKGKEKAKEKKGQEKETTRKENEKRDEERRKGENRNKEQKGKEKRKREKKRKEIMRKNKEGEENRVRKSKRLIEKKKMEKIKEAKKKMKENRKKKRKEKEEKNKNKRKRITNTEEGTKRRKKEEINKKRKREHTQKRSQEQEEEKRMNEIIEGKKIGSNKRKRRRKE